MRIGVPKEIHDGECRVAASPDVVRDLIQMGFSVAIEAGQFITRGEIWAVEQKRDRITQIHANRRRFGIGNLNVVETRLPDGLADLPDPDRIFVGGHSAGANLRQAAKTSALTNVYLLQQLAD